MSNEKIITYITDGVGNQLFQYAFGYALSKKYGQDFYIDNQYFYYNKTRKYELDKFNIKENIVHYKFDGSLPEYYEQSFHYDKNIDGIKGSCFLRGFWQSEKYFEDVKDDLKKFYTFKSLDFIKNPHYLKMIESSNSVAVHIRTGDYLIPPFCNTHFVCKQDYYINAIDKIKNVVENPVFFVFSDNLNFAKNLLPNNANLIIVESDGWQEDFYFMQKTKHNIISNSTFSWWAAWLNNNPDKIVIAPEKWFTDITPLNTKDVLPNSWIKVSVNKC